jgi:hypothetical protein
MNNKQQDNRYLTGYTDATETMLKRERKQRLKHILLGMLIAATVYTAIIALWLFV